jgi:hypothetical protein
LIENFVNREDKKKLAREILTTILKETNNKSEIRVGPLSIERNRKLDRVFHTKYKNDLKKKHPDFFELKSDKLNINIEFFSTVNMNAI